MIKNLFAAFFMAAILASCSSSGNDEPESKLSQEQLNAIVGTWTLVEYNVTPPQDVNGDGTASENLIGELPCLSGTLTLTEEFRFNLSMTSVGITPITGGAFGIFCGSNSTDSGPWIFLNNQILLSEGTDGTLQLSGNTLTQTIGDDLPGVRQLVFSKQ